MNDLAVPRCSICGDAIGTYEPIIVREDGSMRVTSLAREPRLTGAELVAMHHACAEGGESGVPPEPPADA